MNAEIVFMIAWGGCILSLLVHWMMSEGESTIPDADSESNELHAWFRRAHREDLIVMVEPSGDDELPPWARKSDYLKLGSSLYDPPAESNELPESDVQAWFRKAHEEDSLDLHA